MGDDRPAVYVETDREGNAVTVVRASALPGCMRELVALRAGETPKPPPPHMQDAFDRGHRMEDVILPKVAAGEWLTGGGFIQLHRANPKDHKAYRGWPYVRPEFLDGDGDQFTGQLPVTKDVIVRVHLDAIMQVYAIDGAARDTTGLRLGDRVVVEVKNFGPDYWKKWQKSGLHGFEGYQWQTAIERAVTGLPVLFVANRYDEDAEDNIGELDWQLVHEPFVPVSAIKARVLQIERLARSGELPGECDRRVYPCSVFHLHDDEEAECLWVDKKDEAEFDKLVGFYDQGCQWERQGREIKKQYAARIAEFLREKEVAGVGEGEPGVDMRSAKWQLEYKVSTVPASKQERKEHTRTTCRVTMRERVSE